MRQFRQTIGILLLSLIVGSCGDDPCKCASLQNVSDELMSYFPVQQGSYYIYPLSTDNIVIDTLLCTSFKQESNSCDHNDTRTNTARCSNFHIGWFQHYNAEYFPHPHDSSKAGVDDLVLKILDREYATLTRAIANDIPPQTVDVLFFPYEKGVKPFNDQSPYVIDKDQIGLTIGDSLYKNCVRSIYMQEKAEGLRTLDSIYFCPNIGIVQYQDDLNT
ncbi:MAG: hypothetical protein ACI9JN_000726 [Bacteroidia bacterium]|jgi:hypothetical protein